MRNKDYWYITDKGDLDIDIDENKYKNRFRKQIGNYSLLHLGHITFSPFHNFFRNFLSNSILSSPR